MLSEDRLREKLRKIEALYAGATTAGEKSAAGACSAPPKRADAEEDKLHGQDKRGGEMPDWVADKQRRAEKIRQAKAELEAEAKAAAEAELKERAAAEAKREAEGRRRRPETRSAFPDAGRQSLEELYRSTEPDHEEQGRLRAGLQCPDRRRRRSADHRRAGRDARAQVIALNCCQ